MRGVLASTPSRLYRPYACPHLMRSCLQKNIRLTQGEIIFSKFKTGFQYSIPGGALYSGLYGEAPPERDTFFNSGFRYIKGVGISQAEVYKRVGKSAI